jgi:hypothetical protein
MPGALDGILVVGLEQAVAAPYCASRLADAGARVIKVERPDGDFARGFDQVAKGESAYFVWLNRGKESIALNIKDPDGLATFFPGRRRARGWTARRCVGAIRGSSPVTSPAMARRAPMRA